MTNDSLFKSSFDNGSYDQHRKRERENIEYKICLEDPKDVKAFQTELNKLKLLVNEAVSDEIEKQFYSNINEAVSKIVSAEIGKQRLPRSESNNIFKVSNKQIITRQRGRVTDRSENQARRP